MTYPSNGHAPTPQDFGAIGDGVADDTAAVAAWWTEAMISGHGYIPAGIYRITSSQTWDLGTGGIKGFRVVGCGIGRCQFNFVNGATWQMTSASGGSFTCH